MVPVVEYVRVGRVAGAAEPAASNPYKARGEERGFHRCRPRPPCATIVAD
jgi:hypothetical protein